MTSYLLAGLGVHAWSESLITLQDPEVIVYRAGEDAG